MAAITVAFVFGTLAYDMYKVIASSLDFVAKEL